MKNSEYLGPWVKRFLLEYLISIKNLSKNTQQSYRDTLRLLIPFASKKVHKSIEKLLVEDINNNIIKGFLLDLEKNRNCSVSTRNQRLSALHSFAKFVGINSPEHTEWCRQIMNIPSKRGESNLITYLTKLEMDALLAAPDKNTAQGMRDYILLLFLYNTGARADEVANLTIADLNLAHAKNRDLSTVLIKGKGNKLRRCPLWVQTTNMLSKIIQNRDGQEQVFLNRYKEPLTRFGIYNMVKRYVKKIREQIPSLIKKRISPHTVRHTTATHLLQAGVDINTIRAWLGHVSINTTNIYAEVDLEMKARALAHCEIVENQKQPTHWRDNKKLMSFLDSI